MAAIGLFVVALDVRQVSAVFHVLPLADSALRAVRTSQSLRQVQPEANRKYGFGPSAMPWS
jgi:hypothetical protein